MLKLWFWCIIKEKYPFTLIRCIRLLPLLSTHTHNHTRLHKWSAFGFLLRRRPQVPVLHLQAYVHPCQFRAQAHARPFRATSVSLFVLSENIPGRPQPQATQFRPHKYVLLVARKMFKRIFSRRI